MDEKFFAVIEKIKNKEKLEDAEGYSLMGKGNDQAEKDKIKELAKDLFDYVKFWLEKGVPTSEMGKGPYGIVIMLNNAYRENDEFMFECFPYMIECMKLIGKMYTLLDKDDDLNNLCSIMGIPLSTHLPKKTQYFSSAVPMYVDLLPSKKAGVTSYSMLNQIQMANQRALAPYAEKIIDSVKKCEMANGLFPSLYPQKPDIFHKRIETIWDYFVSFEPNNKIGLITLLGAIAKGEPKVLTPYINRPELKDALFSQMTGAMALYVVKDYAAYDAQSLVEWVDELKDVVNQQSWAIFTVPYVYGYIGRTSVDNGKKMADLLMGLVEKNKGVSTNLAQVLMALKNIQDYNVQIIQPHIPVIKGILESTTDGVVRNQAQAIVDVAEKKDLKSVNQKVEKNTSDIKEVKVEVSNQNAKIEEVKAEVKDNTEKVAQVQVEVKQNTEAVKDMTQRVDKVEVKVDEQGKQIQQILDKFDEMNVKFAGACKNYDDLKAYVDQNVEMLKDFIAEVAKKLPSPYKFSAEGYVRRKMLLYFTCGTQLDGECMYTKASPYTTETSDWAKWLKVGFSLAKLGKALYDKEIFDVVENTKAIYDIFKQKEDQDYLSYISQPFLTSVEQDNLINQLRDQRFFDLFMYSSQKAVWVCSKCGKKELVQRGKADPTPTTNSNPSSPTNPAKASKVTGTLQVNVGMFGKMKKMLCEYENDVLSVKNPKNQKLKVAINKKEIVNYKEGDVRVTKKENYFSVITKDKTYNLIAESKDQYDAWKVVLKV